MDGILFLASVTGTATLGAKFREFGEIRIFSSWFLYTVEAQETLVFLGLVTSCFLVVSSG
jgi:hypothetical protein